MSSDDPATQPPVRTVNTVGIVGSGIMGAGIAQAAAYAGFKVLLYDIHEEILDRGVKRITALFDGLVEKGKLTAALL